MSFRLAFQQRWGNNYKTYWYQEYQGTFQYDITDLIPICTERTPFKSLILGLGVRETSSIATSTTGLQKWVGITRSLLEANLSLELDKWEINQRMRLEYHYYQASTYKNFTNYRHRIFVYTPWKYTCHEINPYIGNESFFRESNQFLSGGYYENRFRIGFAGIIYKKLTSELWWQWKTIKSNTDRDNWINTYQIGLSLFLNL